MYPVFGLNTGGVKLTINFGNDLASKPFRWEPGNEADQGIGFVAEKEDMLIRRPLRRRTTQIVLVASGSEDTTEGAEASATAKASPTAEVQPDSNGVSLSE